MVSSVIVPVFLTLVAVLSAQEAPGPASPAPPPLQSGAEVFNQAPPGVEEALRARLKTFYDCYLTGKFRIAYELVAEENKDDYFNRAKTPYHSYKIAKIEFSDDYTKAKVLVVVNRDFHIQGHILAADVPLAENWKVESGQWVWYLPDGNMRQMPFGKDSQVPNSAANASDSTKPRPNVQGDPKSLTAAFNRLAWPDKPVLTLGFENQFQDRAVLTNNSDRPLTFHLEFNPLAGLKVEPATGQIESGHSITIQVRYESPDHALPLDRSARTIHVLYDGGGTVQFEIVWGKDVAAKTTPAKMQ